MCEGFLDEASVLCFPLSGQQKNTQKNKIMNVNIIYRTGVINLGIVMICLTMVSENIKS